MSNYKVNIGDLNKRIVIEKFTSTLDEEGFPIEKWTTFKTIWAGISNLSGREYFAAMAVQSENTLKFVIRYLKELDSNINIEGPNTTKLFRVKYKNAFYNITFIDNIKYGNNFLEIKALLEVV